MVNKDNFYVIKKTMTLFQFKPFSFINIAIKRIVKSITANAKRRCFFLNLTNETFWRNTPSGQEILEFFKGMTDSQKIEFFGFFDIFVFEFHNGINAYVSMMAGPSSRNFKKTLWVSISKGYNRLSHHFSGLETPLGDLRSSIGSTPVQSAGFSTSPAVSQNSNQSAFQQGLLTFGTFQGFGGLATQPVSPFQGFGGLATQPVSPFQGFGGLATQPVSPFQEFQAPMSEFSLFCSQPPSLGGYFQPIVRGGSTDPFTLQADFVPLSSATEPVSRQGQTRLAIKKGRVIRVEIPSSCSSGPSTSSTVGISKSPKAQTPVATTIANLEKKVASLKKLNPEEGSSNYLTLVISQAKLAKLKKMRNSL